MTAIIKVVAIEKTPKLSVVRLLPRISFSPWAARNPITDETKIHLPKPMISWAQDRSQPGRQEGPGKYQWLMAVLAAAETSVPASRLQTERVTSASASVTTMAMT